MRRPVLSCLAAVTLLTLVAFAARAVSLDAQSLWRDEVDALRFATVPWPEMLSSFVRHGWNGPLYFFLLRGWVVLAGTSEYGMRFFSLVFGVLCVPLVYVLGRRLLNRQAGLAAALLVAVSPYLVWYAQEVKMYTLVPALAILAVYGLRRAVEGSGWHWWAVQVVATSAAFYCHILAALLIPVQLLIYFAWWPRARRQWVGALVSLACLTLPYLPLAAWQVPLLLDDGVMNLLGQPLGETAQVLLDSWRTGDLELLRARETGFTPYTLGQMVEVLLNGWGVGIFGSSGWGWPWNMMLVAILAAFGLLSPLVFSYNGRRMKARFALLAWFVGPLVAVWFVSLRQPIFTDRYLVWSAPAFYLLVAAGLVFFLRFGDWGRAAAACLVGLILVANGANLWRQAADPVKSDFRAAAAYVANYRRTGGSTAARTQSSRGVDEIDGFKSYLPFVASGYGGFEGLIVFQIPYARYTFDHYFPVDEYPWADGLYTNHRAPDDSYLMSEREAARQMQAATASYDVVWLVVTEMEMWDERGLVRAWLEGNMQRTDEAHFMRVDVYRYVE